MSFPVGEDIAPGLTLPSRGVRITATHIVAGAFASRDWRPQHHDHRTCVDDYGLPAIIMNTPTQAGWIAAYPTAWSGPGGRVARISFRMRRPIVPDTQLTFGGTVEAVARTGACWWARIGIELADAASDVRTASRLLIALPSRNGPQPWQLRGDDIQVPSWELEEIGAA